MIRLKIVRDTPQLQLNNVVEEGDTLKIIDDVVDSVENVEFNV